MVELTHSPIDTARLLHHVESTRAGGVVLFLGVTREWTGDQRTESLDYDGYDEMAVKKLAELESEARQQWPIVQCAVVHRLGHLLPGEASVGIAVACAHRKAAFEACEWLIDRIKKVVPIWKKENGAGGESQWVHPGVPPAKLPPPSQAPPSDSNNAPPSATEE